MSTHFRTALRNKAALLLLRLLLVITGRLPLALSRRLGRGFGFCYYAADTRGRHVATTNIGLAYPHLDPSERNRLVKATLQETGVLAFEMGHVWHRPWEHTQQLIVDTEGVDLVLAALQEGRGVIVLGPHLGNWEVLGLHLATLGDMVALFEPPKIDTLGPLIKAARERSGGRLVPTTPRGLADLAKSVKAGGVSGILPDQVPDSPAGGINVPFMGVDCATASLGCNLVKRSGAIAFMGAAYRVAHGFRVCYRAVPDALYSNDSAIALTAMNAAVEDMIAGYEAQYQWQYKRFRLQPPSTVDHYARHDRRH